MPPPPRQPGPRPEMVQMSGSLDPATANASSADHVVQFPPRKPVLLGKTGSPFFARLGRQRFLRVARALFSAEVYPPSILFPYFALPCTILTCLCASVWFWQRYCRFGIGAVALQACFRARSCTPSADQCFASITFETQTPRLSAWRWARLDISFIPNEMALLARCFELSFLNIFATTTAGPRLLWEAPPRYSQRRQRCPPPRQFWSV